MKQTSFRLDNQNTPPKTGTVEANLQAKIISQKDTLSPESINRIIVSLIMFVLLLIGTINFIKLSSNNQTSASINHFYQSSQHLAFLLAKQAIFLEQVQLTKLKSQPIVSGFTQVQTELLQTSQHPTAQANLTQIQAELNDWLVQPDSIMADLMALEKMQNERETILNLISDEKFKLAQATESTLARLAAYKAENNFEQLTANANSSDLFNALNQKQGEEKFEQLQLSANNFVESIEAIYYLQQTSELDKYFIRYQNAQTDFENKLRDFSDMPTRMALGKWYKNFNQSPDLQPAEIQLFNQKRLSLTEQSKQALMQLSQFTADLQLTLNKLTQHIILSRLNQEDNKRAYWAVLALVVFLFVLMVWLSFRVKLFPSIYLKSISNQKSNNN